MAGIYLDATQAEYIRMILRCGLTVVPCQFRGTLRPCVRIECIAAVQRAYGFSRNLDGTLPLVSKRPEKYRQVSRRRVCAWMAVCKTVGLAYVGSNPTPATQNPRSDPVPVFPEAGPAACPGAVRQTVPGWCGPVVGQTRAGQRLARNRCPGSPVRAGPWSRFLRPTFPHPWGPLLSRGHGEFTR